MQIAGHDVEPGLFGFVCGFKLAQSRQRSGLETLNSRLAICDLRSGTYDSSSGWWNSFPRVWVPAIMVGPTWGFDRTRLVPRVRIYKTNKLWGSPDPPFRGPSNLAVLLLQSHRILSDWLLDGRSRRRSYQARLLTKLQLIKYLNPAQGNTLSADVNEEFIPKTLLSVF